MNINLPAGSARGMFVWALASTVFVAGVAQSDQRTGAPSASTGAQYASVPKASPYRPARTHARAREYYQSAWGVDSMLVRQTASSNLIRFSYRVTDPERAKVLGDKRATPYMIGQRSHAVLQIPVMEKIGQLRQTGTPVAGKEYWMVFSNKGNLVKPGDVVSVVIGTFHADGLVVE